MEMCHTVHAWAVTHNTRTSAFNPWGKPPLPSHGAVRFPAVVYLCREARGLDELDASVLPLHLIMSSQFTRGHYITEVAQSRENCCPTNKMNLERSPGVALSLLVASVIGEGTFSKTFIEL